MEDRVLVDESFVEVSGFESEDKAGFVLFGEDGDGCKGEEPIKEYFFDDFVGGRIGTRGLA